MPEKNFVAHLVKDPANVPATSMVTGFPGASTEKGFVRIYLEADLSNHIDVPENAILHKQAAGDSLGSFHVWVAKGELDKLRLAYKELGPATFAPPCPTVVEVSCMTKPGQCPPVPKTGGNPFCTVSAPNPCQSDGSGSCLPTPVFQCHTQTACQEVTAPDRCISSNSKDCETVPLTGGFKYPSVGAPCVTVAGACQSAIQCNSLGGCPSWVDACGSAPAGCGTVGTLLTTTPVQQTGQFGQLGQLAQLVNMVQKIQAAGVVGGFHHY